MIGGIFTVVIQLFILVGCMTYIVGKNGLPDMIPLILVLVTNIIVTSILLTAIGLFALVISFALLTGAMWLFFKYEIGQCLKIVGLYTGIVFLWSFIGAMI